jgi:hypothetical protein
MLGITPNNASGPRDLFDFVCFGRSEHCVQSEWSVFVKHAVLRSDDAVFSSLLVSNR